MFNDSNYVNEMRNKQIAEFDRQQAKKQFTAKYKGQIEQGFTCLYYPTGKGKQ